MLSSSCICVVYLCSLLGKPFVFIFFVFVNHTTPVGKMQIPSQQFSLAYYWLFKTYMFIYSPLVKLTPLLTWQPSLFVYFDLMKRMQLILYVIIHKLALFFGLTLKYSTIPLLKISYSRSKNCTVLGIWKSEKKKKQNHEHKNQAVHFCCSHSLLQKINTQFWRGCSGCLECQKTKASLSCKQFKLQ